MTVKVQFKTSGWDRAICVIFTAQWRRKKIKTPLRDFLFLLAVLCWWWWCDAPRLLTVHKNLEASMKSAKAEAHTKHFIMQRESLHHGVDAAQGEWTNICLRDKQQGRQGESSHANASPREKSSPGDNYFPLLRMLPLVQKNKWTNMKRRPLQLLELKPQVLKKILWD